MKDLIRVGLVAGLAIWCLMSLSTPAAVPPVRIDELFATGDEKDVATAIYESGQFKRAVKAAVEARNQRKGEIGADRNKSIGNTPVQAARVKFIEVLQGK